LISALDNNSTASKSPQKYNSRGTGTAKKKKGMNSRIDKQKLKIWQDEVQKLRKENQELSMKCTLTEQKLKSS